MGAASAPDIVGRTPKTNLSSGVEAASALDIVGRTPKTNLSSGVEAASASGVVTQATKVILSGGVEAASASGVVRQATKANLSGGMSPRGMLREEPPLHQILWDGLPCPSLLHSPNSPQSRICANKSSRNSSSSLSRHSVMLEKGYGCNGSSTNPSRQGLSSVYAIVRQ